ncbi:hypothetical protein DTO271D3_6614 [Paecilomyces variotii]|nr:hypothetical protein DTO271D3_6614 [Paecilomyces variotii]
MTRFGFACGPWVGVAADTRSEVSWRRVSTQSHDLEFCRRSRRRFFESTNTSHSLCASISIDNGSSHLISFDRFSFLSFLLILYDRSISSP